MGAQPPGTTDESWDEMNAEEAPFEDGTPNTQREFDKALSMVVRHYLDKTFLTTEDVVQSLRYTAESIEEGLEPTTDTARSAVQYVALETGSRVGDLRGELVDARTIDGTHVVTTKVAHTTAAKSWFVPDKPARNLYRVEGQSMDEVVEEHVETQTE